MPEGNSLINLGEISKPATVLVEKISDAVGRLFKPIKLGEYRRPKLTRKLSEHRPKSRLRIFTFHHQKQFDIYRTS